MGRYFRRGKSKIYFLPAISNKAAPTSGEIAAGTNLTPSIQDPGNFEFSNSPIATPDLDTTFTSQIPGEDTAGDAQIAFYDDDTATTIRTTLAKGVAGYIVRMPLGNVTAKRAEVFPVTCTGVNDNYSAGNEAALFTVGFAITATPTLSAVLP